MWERSTETEVERKTGMEKGEKYRMLPFLWKKGKGELKRNKRNKILSSEEKNKEG